MIMCCCGGAFRWHFFFIQAALLTTRTVESVTVTVPTEPYVEPFSVCYEVGGRTERGGRLRKIVLNDV